MPIRLRTRTVLFAVLALASSTNGWSKTGVELGMGSDPFDPSDEYCDFILGGPGSLDADVSEVIDPETGTSHRLAAVAKLLRSTGEGSKELGYRLLTAAAQDRALPDASFQALLSAIRSRDPARAEGQEGEGLGSNESQGAWKLIALLQDNVAANRASDALISLGLRRIPAVAAPLAVYGTIRKIDPYLQALAGRGLDKVDGREHQPDAIDRMGANIRDGRDRAATSIRNAVSRLPWKRKRETK